MAQSDEYVEFDPKLRTPAEIEQRLGGPERPPQVTANWQPGRATRPARGPRKLYAGWTPPVRQQMVGAGTAGPLTLPDDHPEVTLDQEPPERAEGDEPPAREPADGEQSEQAQDPPPPVEDPPEKPARKPHRS